MAEDGGGASGRADAPGPRPTMMDVAARAGVSQTTVSLVLNNSRGARLSATTRQRVRAAAAALGYSLPRREVGRDSGRPEPSRTGTITFLADEIIADPWCAMQLEGVREKAWQHGLTVSALVSHGDADLEASLLADALSRPLVGLIYATVLTRHIEPPPALLAVPTVLLNCYALDHSLPSVVPGELLGGYTATRVLLDAGHRRVAHIHGQSWTDPSRDRLRGYRRALAERDIPFDPALILPGNWEPPTGHAQTLKLMALPDPPTAIFAANDMMAVGVYDALKELGLAIPGDVSVIGYDDREIAQFLRPPLTTVVLPHHEMSCQAVEMLLDGAPGSGSRQPQVKVECPLVPRASVAPPPARANRR